MRASSRSSGRAGPAGLLRPDLPPRILLAALVSVIGYGLIPFLLLRLPHRIQPLLVQVVPSPDSSRIVEWLSLVLVPLATSGLLGAAIMGSRRGWTGSSPRRIEGEILTTGGMALCIAQCLAVPVGVIYFRSVGLPISAWEMVLAALMGALGGAINLSLVRLAIAACRGRRFLGALASLPILGLAMLPAALRLASPLCRRLAPWTPYYHVTLPLELRSTMEPGRVLFALAILLVWAALGRGLVLNRLENKG